MLKIFVSVFCFVFIFISCGTSDFQKALSYQNDAEYEKALEFYAKAISKNDNVAQAEKNRGDIFFAKKDFKKAFACYKHSIEVDPNLIMEDVFKLLSDREKDVRNATKEMLVKVQNEQTKEKIFENLSKMLKSEKQFEKLDALEVVSAFGNGINPIINDVVELVNDDNITIRQKVFSTLPQISDIAISAGAIEKLFNLIDNSNDMIKASAIECIGNMRNISSYLPQLIDIAKTKPQLKQVALDAIRKSNTVSKQDAQNLKKYLSDESSEIKILTLSLFKKMGNEANSFVPEMILLSVDTNKEVADNAKSILENIKSTDSSVVPELVKLLDNKNKQVKLEAIRWLANIGSAASEAVEPLKILAKEKDKEIKSSANLALKQING